MDPGQKARWDSCETLDNYIPDMKRIFAKITGWWKNHKLPARFVFIVTGVLSTTWFLIRVWIGTLAGISVYENNSLSSLSGGDGILGSNVLSIAVDKKGVVWIGTNYGVTSYYKGDITRYMQ